MGIFLPRGGNSKKSEGRDYVASIGQSSLSGLYYNRQYKQITFGTLRHYARENDREGYYTLCATQHNNAKMDAEPAQMYVELIGDNIFFKAFKENLKNPSTVYFFVNHPYPSTFGRHIFVLPFLKKGVFQARRENQVQEA